MPKYGKNIITLNSQKLHQKYFFIFIIINKKYEYKILIYFTYLSYNTSVLHTILVHAVLQHVPKV